MYIIFLVQTRIAESRFIQTYRVASDFVSRAVKTIIPSIKHFVLHLFENFHHRFMFSFLLSSTLQWRTTTTRKLLCVYEARCLSFLSHAQLDSPLGVDPCYKVTQKTCCHLNFDRVTSGGDIQRTCIQLRTTNM